MIVIRTILRVIRRHLPPSIRAQMTIFYALTFGVLLLVILIGAVALLRFSAPINASNQLNDFAHDAAANISFQGGRVCIHDPLRDLPARDARLPLCTDPEPTTTTPAKFSANVMMRVLDLQGNVIYVSPAFTNLNIPASTTGLTLGELKHSGPTTITGHPNQNAYFLSTVLFEKQQDDRVFAILQLGTPITRTTFDDNRLLLIVYPILVLLGGVAAYGIATRAMRPVRRVTKAAQQIALGDLQQRVPVPVSRDDIHTLALTFNEMASKLDAAFTQQRRFVADASHELRTPVAVIRSMTDVALAGTPSATEYQTTLREVNAEAERLGRLINTLLGLARVDDGRQPQDRESVHLDLLATDLVDSVAPLAHEHGLTLALVRNDPATVRGDTAQLIQILMSLTENAINYTHSGGHINLSVAVAGATARVQVSDTGIGIGPDALPHIFERFYRADPARARVAGGNGLGLALAREFAQAHGGDITVLSRVNQGSTFTVTLPLVPAPPASPSPPLIR